MGWDDRDEAEARAEAMEARRRLGCQCGDDLPGRCPGPMNCPYSDYAPDDEDGDSSEDEDPYPDCGRWFDPVLGEQCTKAGSEECDWDCPHSR